MATYRTLADVDFFRKTALVRIDTDVEISANGVVDDPSALAVHVPTIEHITKAGGRVLLLGHRGQPQGQPNSGLSLKPLTEVFGALLSKDIGFTPDCIGRSVEQAVAELPFGDVLLLENTHFHAEDLKNDINFSRYLTENADYFVFDSFSLVTQEMASTSGCMKHLTSIAGASVMQEILQFEHTLNTPKAPVLAIIGGAKISTKIDVLQHLISKVDMLMLGGGVANTFLEAKDLPMGKSLLEPNYIEAARDILAEAGILGCRILLPQDLVTASALEHGVETQVKVPGKLTSNDIALDIGPATTTTWAKVISGAQTIIWAGPLGAYETSPFEAGSMTIAQALAKADANSLVGGTDTVACLEKLQAVAKNASISRGSDVFLAYLSGKELPLLKNLER